jgi:hypothetical protein
MGWPRGTILSPPCLASWLRGERVGGWARSGNCFYFWSVPCSKVNLKRTASLPHPRPPSTLLGVRRATGPRSTLGAGTTAHNFFPPSSGPEEGRRRRGGACVSGCPVVLLRRDAAASPSLAAEKQEPRSVGRWVAWWHQQPGGVAHKLWSSYQVSLSMRETAQVRVASGRPSIRRQPDSSLNVKRIFLCEVSRGGRRDAHWIPAGRSRRF